MTRESPLAVALAAIDRPVSLFASALAGRPLRLIAVPRPSGDWNGWQGDAATIALPQSLLAGARHGMSAAMRVEVLRHVVDVLPGGRWHFDAAQAEARGLRGPSPRGPDGDDDALCQCLASWPRPRLLRRLFCIIEGGRIDVAIAQRFPGARADLQQRHAAVLARLGSRCKHPARAVLRALQRSLPGGLGNEAEPSPEATDLEGRALHLAAPALLDTATVHDSLRAAIDIAALLGAEHGSRREAAVSERWLHSDDAAAEPPAATHSQGAGASIPLRPEAGFSVLKVRGARGGDGPQARPKSGVASPGTGVTPAAADPAVQVLVPGRHGAGAGAQEQTFRHDEWHYLEQRYRRAWTQVHEQRLRGDNLQFLGQLRQRHGDLAASIRRRIGKVRPARRERARRMPEGDEIDVDAAIEARIERRAGRQAEGQVYTAQQPSRRDVGAAFLLDVSGSTGFLVPQPGAPGADEGPCEDDDPYFYASPMRRLSLQPPRRRVIDVAKDAIGLMCDALARLGDRHAVFGFSGEGRHQVEFYVAKAFDDAWSMHSAAALASMEPKGSTRTGAAIRHAAPRRLGARTGAHAAADRRDRWLPAGQRTARTPTTSNTGCATRRRPCTRPSEPASPCSACRWTMRRTTTCARCARRRATWSSAMCTLCPSSCRRSIGG